MSDGGEVLLEAVGRAALLREYCFGIRPGESHLGWDPVYPYHGAPRVCPFCGDVYIRHGGFADHRDQCEAGPSPGSNPDYRSVEWVRQQGLGDADAQGQTTLDGGIRPGGDRDG